MKIVGLAQKFWVVTQPSANSPLGDFCFECDFRRFALQVRGGLDEASIKGIFAEQKDAEAFAGSLIGGVEVEQVEVNSRIFYVGTLSRYVLVKAFNAASALKAGELHPVLNGSDVLTVRIATPDEIELTNWHEQKIDEERRVSAS